MSGFIVPTFSTYAQSLGASFVFIGVLSTVLGLTSLVSAIPAGYLSDHIGRRRLMLIGMLTWAAANVLFALAPSAGFLIPGRVLMGLAGILTMGVGAALVGDLTSGKERNYAFGLFSTSMGIGFTLSPLAGGLIADAYGIAVSYQVAALVALAGFVFGYFALPGKNIGQAPVRSSVRLGRFWTQLSLKKVKPALANSGLMMVCVVTFLQATAFSGTIVAFLPLYAERALIGPAAVATMFSLRSLASTAVRIPSGALAAVISNPAVLVISLICSSIAMVGMGQTDQQAWLLAFMMLQGLGHGTFTTSGQALVADVSGPENRGTAMGVFRMAMALGGTVSPVIMGVIAGSWGLDVVFTVTGAVIVLGTLGSAWWLYRQISTQRVVVPR